VQDSSLHSLVPRANWPWPWSETIPFIKKETPADAAVRALGFLLQPICCLPKPSRETRQARVRVGRLSGQSKADQAPAAAAGGADGSDRAQLVGGASMILSHVMLLALRPHSPPRAAARPAGRADQLLLREMVFCLLFCSLRAGRNHGLTRRLLVDEF